MTSHWAARFYYPEPLTRRFAEFLRSVELGSPRYDRLAPDAASRLSAGWPALRQASRKWRGPRTLVFLRRNEDGSHLYKASYADHAVFWTVSPLDAAGRLTGVECDEGA